MVLELASIAGSAYGADRATGGHGEKYYKESGFDPLDPFGDKAAAEQQMAAAKEALQMQIEEAQRARDFAEERSDLGIALAGEQTGLGVEALEAYTPEQIAALQAGTTGAAGALGGGRDASLAELAAGYGGARGDLARLQGLQGYERGATRGIGAYDVTGQRSRLAELVDDPGALERDAGYRFRREQGEEAINRAAAARGGRAGGRALKDLARFNQGLASQEYGAAAQRAAQVDAMRQQALFSQAGRADAAAMQAQQNQMALTGMGYGAQGALAQLAAQQGQLGAGVQGQYAGSLSDLYRQQGAGMADIYGRTGAGIAELYGQLGATQAGTATGAGAQSSAISQTLLGQMTNPVQYAGGGLNAQGNTAKTGIGIFSSIYGGG